MLGYNYTQFFIFCQIISEEEIKETECGDLASPTLLMEELQDSNMGNLIVEELPVKDLTAWIDPLDATQEFSGFFILQSHE